MALLEAYGFSNVSLYAAQGRERSDPREDIYRWEGFATSCGGVSAALYSWDTMTKCVSRGIVATNHNTDGGPTTWEISAK